MLVGAGLKRQQHGLQPPLDEEEEASIQENLLIMLILHIRRN